MCDSAVCYPNDPRIIVENVDRYPSDTEATRLLLQSDERCSNSVTSMSHYPILARCLSQHNTPPTFLSSRMVLWLATLAFSENSFGYLLVKEQLLSYSIAVKSPAGE